jgi:hypothetical protein
MVLESHSFGSKRMLTFLLPILAVLCVSVLALSSDGAELIDNETAPNPPLFDNWANAYVMDQLELDTNLTIRKDGGGDDDYIQLPFLVANDVVTVTVNQTEDTTTVEYWASDPNKFPVHLYQFNGPPMNPNFTFQFVALITGPYYIHTGQGFGDTFINMTITKQSQTPPSAKDNNNEPGDKKLLTSDQVHRQNAGAPWDPSDFFFINIQPNLAVNKYLSLNIETAPGTKVQWELYSSTGINRPSETYTSDTIIFGSGIMEHRRIMTPDDYNIRIWMMEGYGQYNLTVSILSYPNDQDNSIEEATGVTDDSQQSGDVNLSFDIDDYYEIYLEAGEPLWVRLNMTGGPADLYIFNDLEEQKKAARKSGLQEEFIPDWRDHDEGFFYIVVEAVYEAPIWEFPPTVDYTLEVWINYGPNVKSGIDATMKHKHVDEDTSDNTYDISTIFEDKDGDILVFDMDMSYNDTLLTITLLPDNTLDIVPIDDASDFKVQLLFNATDPQGLWVNYTAFIWVDPVNDGPYVDFDEGPFEVIMGEDLVKSGVNVTKAFRDIDDDYKSWTFAATSTDHIEVELDPVTWLATFEPQETDWFGDEQFTVTCTDKGDLTAVITFNITMYEINDPPTIINYIPEVEIMEEGEFTVDLADPVGGAYFLDPEDKAMTYGFANNTTISITISGSLITFTGQKDIAGTVSGLEIWAIDDLGATSDPMSLLVTIEPIDDDPELEAILTTATVVEGEGVTFAQDVYFTFVDIDSTPFELTWEWFVDDEKVPPEQISDRYAFMFTPEVTSEKDRTVIVRLEVTGDSGNTKEAEWTVTVTNLNVAPVEPTVTSEKTTYKEGETMTFSANSSDLDGDNLIYKWFLDELEEVGTGATLTLKNVKPGSHKVTVEVTDTSGAASEKDFEFKVEKKASNGDSPGFGGPLTALALLGVVSLLVLRRRR